MHIHTQPEPPHDPVNPTENRNQYDDILEKIDSGKLVDDINRMETARKLDIVRNSISVPASLEQLAEECTELAKAALKCARIFRNENPTPTTAIEAKLNLEEEFTDVIICCDLLGVRASPDIYKYKLKRWIDRLSDESDI